MTAQPPEPSRQPGVDSFERNLQRIRLRQDTTENWLKNDPVPASGELCYTIDGGTVGEKLKVGNGTARWSQIPYLAGRGQSGPPGPPGADGAGVQILGTIDHCGPPTSDDMPNPNAGDVVIVDCDNCQKFVDGEQVGCDGDLWAYQRNATWLYSGNLLGPQGPQGPKGDKGDKGDPFVYSDFTEDQLADLEGPVGPQGPEGPQGEKGDKGDNGDTPTISLTSAVDVKKDDTVVNNKGTFTLQNTDTLNPRYSLELELIPDSGEDINLKMCEITDVICPTFPPVNGEVLILNTTGDDAVWEPNHIGSADLGSEPIGGWPEGSLGDALQDITAGLPISSSDNKVTLSDDNGSFQIETGDPTADPSTKEVRVVVDSIGNVTIKEKLKGDGNYTPLIELAAGYTVNVTKSRYYNYYAADSSTTHREIVYNTDNEAACSFLVYGKTYASGLPVGIPDGEQPSLFNSSHDLVYEVKRTLWCSSSTNAQPDVVIDCTTDTEDPVLKVVDKGHIEASRIQTDTIKAKNAVANGPEIDLSSNKSVVVKAAADGVVNFQVNNAGKLTISDDDIAASNVYEPQTDHSLVTRGWVNANAGGASGTLPISSVNGFTTLDALAVAEFSVRAKQTKLYNQSSDDVNLILHHNKSWVEGNKACYLYAGDVSGGMVGVGTGCTISVGRTVDNPAYIPPDDPDNPRPPEYDDTIPETIIETHDSFRVCPEHGNVALGDTLTGAATNGVFARWDGRSLRTNFVTYCDVGTIPEVPKAVNPDYIGDVDSRPDDYNPATPEYILDPNATAEELKQYVSVMYGHWSQIGSLNTVGEAGGAPLTTVNFFAPPNAAAGVKTVSKGFLHQSENKVTSKSFGFESQQTLVQGVEAYAFYASGSAPSRFNGQIQTDTITTKTAATGDAEIALNGKTASVRADGINKAVIGTYPYKRNKNDTDATASISSRNGTLQAYASTVSNADVVAIDIYEGLNNAGAGMSIQWNNAGGAFDCPASEILSKRQSGSNFSLIFSAMVNNAPQEYLTLSGGQLTAYSGYEPSDDNSLATKKYVDDNSGGGSGSSTLAGLTDTNITTPLAEQFLIYEGGKWTNKGSIGSDPITPPGTDPGQTWESYNWSTQTGGAKGNGSRKLVAMDGVFSDGSVWSFDGIEWNSTGYAAKILLNPVKSTKQGTIYMNGYGNYYSYNLKNWFPANGISGNTTTFGNVLNFAGTFYIWGRYRSDPRDDYAGRLFKYNPFDGSWEWINSPAQGSVDYNILGFTSFINFQNASFAPNYTPTSNYNTLNYNHVICNGTVIQVDPTTGVHLASQGITGEVPESIYTDQKGRWVAQYQTGTKQCTGDPNRASNWSAISLYPQAASYDIPVYDGVSRWHMVSNTPGQDLYLYAEESDTMTWVKGGGLTTKTGGWLTGTNGRILYQASGGTTADQTTYNLSGAGISNYSQMKVNKTLEERIAALELLLKERDEKDGS